MNTLFYFRMGRVKTIHWNTRFCIYCRTRWWHFLWGRLKTGSRCTRPGKSSGRLCWLDSIFWRMLLSRLHWSALICMTIQSVRRKAQMPWLDFFLRAALETTLLMDMEASKSSSSFQSFSCALACHPCFAIWRALSSCCSSTSWSTPPDISAGRGRHTFGGS